MPWIFLSSLLLYFAFPNIFSIHGFWFFAWFFAIPLFYVLEGKPLFKRILLGFAWGLLTYGLLVNWVGQVHWLGYTLLVVVLALQPVIFAALFISLKNKYFSIFYYPAAWTASEFLRTLVFDGFSWGVAHSQSYQPQLIQLAAITGSYGISFLLVFVNSCLYFAIRKPSSRVILLSMAGIVFALNLFYGINLLKNFSLLSPSVRVAAIQPNISPTEKHASELIDENFIKQYDLSRSCIADPMSPEIILWPETAYPDDILKNPGIHFLLSDTARAYGGAFLIGSALSENEKDFNSAVFIDKWGKTQGVYHKQHLVPLSESPLLGRVSRLFGGYQFSEGKSLGVFELEPDVLFGTAICSEGSYPKMFRDLKKSGVVFVAIILNDAWFKSASALMMHAQHEIMRAVEVRLPIVRGSNSGFTCLILPTGQIDTERAPALQTKGCGDFIVPLGRHPSIYAKFGDFFAVLTALFVIIVFIKKLK